MCVYSLYIYSYFYLKYSDIFLNMVIQLIGNPDMECKFA